MSTISHIPTPIAGEPVRVVQKVIKEVDCPNPDCDYRLNITDINEGTKIKCANCNNITWVPSYKPKWWQRLRNFIWTLIISFVLGILASIIGSAIYENFISKPKNEKTEYNENKRNVDKTLDSELIE